MGGQLDILNQLHRRAKRDYLPRMVDDKVHCMTVAKQYGRDFWDGDRKYGYGGYKYDGRWEVVARDLINTYDLKPDAKILDVGCGKGFLLYELKKLLPEAEVAGFDISEYAIENAHDAVRSNLFVYGAQNPLPYGDDEFDLVYSITTLHNLKIYELATAFAEIERVGKKGYITVESYRSNQELFNVQCWALTCASFHSTEEWIWLMREFGYTGDFEFIYFE